MKRAITISLTLLIAVALVAPAAAARVRAGGHPSTRPADLKAALLAVLEVERQSQAYYRAVLNKQRPFHPFWVVLRMERQHEEALIDELRQHAIAVPENRRAVQDVEVPDDRFEALGKAVELEKKTVALYAKAVKQSSGDLRRTLERLRAESQDHRNWFEDPETCPSGGAGRGSGRGRTGRGPS